MELHHLRTLYISYLMRDVSVVLVFLFTHVDEGRSVRCYSWERRRTGVSPYLQDVVVRRALGNSDLLGDGQRIHEVLIGDVVQLLTVICER